MMASYVSPFFQYKVNMSNRLFHSLKKSKNIADYDNLYLCHISSPVRDVCILSGYKDAHNYGNAYANLPNLEAIPSGYQTAYRSFYSSELPGLKRLCLDFADETFSNAHLSSVDASESISLAYAGPKTFEHCDTLLDIKIPSSVTHLDLTFKDCHSLSSITGTDYVTDVVSGAFMNCSSLLSATLPRCTSITSSAFVGCSSLKAVNLSSITTSSWPSSMMNVIKSSLEELNASNMSGFATAEFSGFKALKKVIMPNLKIVRDGLFNSCTSLSSVDLRGVESIGTQSFSGCSGLISIDLPNVKTLGPVSFLSCRSLSSVTAPLLSSINDSAFIFCTGLQHIDFPNLEEGSASVFYGCSSLVSAEFPKLKKIPAFFMQSAGVRSVSFPALTSFIDTTGGVGQAFIDCPNLSSISMPNCQAFDRYSFGNYNFPKWKEAYFPAGKTFEYSTFSEKSALTTVNIPNAETLGGYCFNNCPSLTGIYAPKVKKFDTLTFGSCYSLSSFSHPLISSLGSQCFYRCRSLSSVDFPSLLSIDINCFEQCSALYSFNMPNGVKDIPSKAFTKSGLTFVDWPSIKSIGDNCFSDCVSLSDVELPALTGIGNAAFSGCLALHDLDLGFNVQSIGNYAFNGSGLSSIVISSNPSVIGSNAFRRNAQDQALTVNFLCDEDDLIANGYPWGANLSSTTFLFNGVPATGAIEEKTPMQILDEEHLKLHMPFTEDLSEKISGVALNVAYGSASNVNYVEFASHRCAEIPATFGLRNTNLVGLPVGGDISMSIWFSPKTQNASTWYTYVSLGNYNQNTQVLNLAGKYQNTIYSGSGGKDISSTVYNQVGSWHHCVVTYNKSTSTVTAYLNGSLVGTQLASLSITNALYIAYGKRQCDERYIREFRIYDCCLTSEEVAMIYTEQNKAEQSEEPEPQEPVVVDVDPAILVGLPPNDEIWYSAGHELTTATSANLTSNSFSNGKGVLKYNSSLLSASANLFNSDDAHVSLVDVRLPSSMTTIGNYAFAGCSGLLLSSMNNDIASIGSYAFSNCYNLSLTSLPSGLNEIGDYAFYNCTSLSSLVFDSTPTTISQYAFNGCSNLTSISVPWTSGLVNGAPWGAVNATITYTGQVEPEPEPEPEDDPNKPDDSKLFFHMPFTSSSQLHENISDINMTNKGSGSLTYQTVGGRDCASTPFTSNTTVSFQIEYAGFNTTDPTASAYVDVSGSFTLAGWIRPKTASVSTWYTFLSIGDYSGTVTKTTDGGITVMKVLNLMIMNSNKIGAGSEGVNIGINTDHPASGTYASSNTVSKDTWYFIVLTYDATNKTADVWMNRTANASSMTHIATAQNLELRIDPSTDLKIYLGYVKNKRQFASQYISNIKIWNYKLSEESINWLYEND